MLPLAGGSTRGYSGSAPIRTPCVNDAAAILFSKLVRKQNAFGSYAATRAAGAARRNGFELSRELPQNI